MKMKLILVESDELLRDELKNLLLFYNLFDIVGEFSGVEDAIQYIRRNPVDVVFCDYQIGDGRTSGDGSYLSVNVKQNYPDIMVVLFGEKEEYAYTALSCSSVEYFVVPVDSLAMQRVVNRLHYLFELQQYKRDSINRSIMIKTKNGYQLTKINDILFVERNNRRNKMVTVDGKEIILSGYTMDEVEKMLQGSHFYRCYQSFIVNLSKVSFIKVNNETKNYSLLFEEYAGEIMLSRDKYAEVVSLLKEKYVRISM